MGQWEQFDQAGHVSRRGRAGDGLLAEEVKENMRLIQENGRSPLTTTIHAAGLALAAILLSSSGSNAWVTISSPSNDSLVTGSVAVKASVANDWWAQLVVDGNAVASGLPAMCHLRGTPRR
jgi:hypothetical protein